jgi:hypothetical protein
MSEQNKQLESRKTAIVQVGAAVSISALSPMRSPTSD